jgi:integrase
MARRAKQVEGVYENVPKSGIWYARLRVNGKLVRKSIGTRAEAIAYIEKARTIKRTGGGVLPTTAKQPARTFSELAKTGSEVTVGELCDDLLRHIRRNPQDYKDQRNPPYRIGLVRTKFGNRSATTVQPFEIADWLDDMVDLAPATRNRLKVTVSAIYKRGKERGRVNVNPARDVKQKRVNNGVVRDLKRDEEDRIRAVLQKAVDSCPPENKRRRERLLHRIYELDVSLGSGMRKGEQYGIVWPDVNFDDRKITARDTKNGETRIIPMIDDVFHALKAIKAMGLKRKNRSRDCPNPSSKDSVFAVGDNKRWWKATLKAAKVTNYRWHDNRHTFCSRLAQSGASLKVIQEAAGHKTIQMAARYAHLHQTHLAEAMSVLNRAA